MSMYRSPFPTPIEGGVLINVHHSSQCQYDDACTIHNKTDHRFRTCPQVFNNKDGHMYRVCPEMKFHLDPDERSIPRHYVEPDCCKE